MIFPLLPMFSQGYQTNLDYLHHLSHQVSDASRVVSGSQIAPDNVNTTGHAVRVPGGTQTYYPAFWIRDAAMMLGGDLVTASEVEGWVRVVAAVQPGKPIDFPHGLHVPAHSIPDHITLQGAACWYPGAYADQGDGHYGYLPPADDAFYFIQMAYELYRLRGTCDFPVQTQSGEQPLVQVCENAFNSVEVDPGTQLVVCSDQPGKGRVDWGFCDSVTKTGLCLMPSLLRWQAATRLAGITHKRKYQEIADNISANVVRTFFRSLPNGSGLLLSATGLGRRDDVWASAFAVWLGALPNHVERKIAKHLMDLYAVGGVVVEGQIRSLPVGGEFGGYWDKASSDHDTYQNGGYWATPTGWYVAALAKVDSRAAEQLLSEYVSYIQAHRADGAPFEWINPKIGVAANGDYGSSACLVYLSLMAQEHPRAR